jgi:NADPH:quinone reductase-like Zn-dependent oxidoreductase
MYPDAPKPPFVVGYEVSGTIDQIGSGVTGLAVGDRVLAMPRFGGYSDTVVLPATQVFRMPSKMSFEEAAALPVVYLTAHHMMLFTGTLRHGAKVLIYSAAGGVGLAAIQLARAHRCEIFGVASPSKHAFLKEQGVAHPLDGNGDLAAEVRLLAPDGIDLILDPVGGRNWKQNYALLGPAGRLVAFGVSSITPGKERSLVSTLGMLMRMKWWNPLTLMNDNKTVSGVNMGHLFDRADLLRPQFEALLAMYERGEIRPHVDRTFSFAEAPQAHHYIHDRKAKGKVLLLP